MPSILIVDDNVHLIALIGKMLAPLAQVSYATSAAAALRHMRSSAPDLVLLDQEMPGMSGIELCQEMLTDHDLSAIPVMFVTGHDDADAEVQALTAGAVDFISKPVNEAILLARVRTQLRLKSLTDQLLRSASIDGLTGLANRRELDQRLVAEWSRAARQGAPLSLLMLDVDHFKLYNDRYGHPAGDQCLRAVAGAVAEQARRASDLAARFGGEEFALVLPDTGPAQAQEIAERLRSQVQALALDHAASPTARHVSVSIGVATSHPVAGAAQHGVSELISRADQALYAAKAHGRNRVFASGPLHAALVTTGLPVSPASEAMREATT